MSKRHAIFTAADARSSSFLLKHWLVSLQQNVDLADIDVNVLDYGLTDGQRAELRARGVHCHPCVKDGHVGSIRFRDLAAILGRRNYDQALSVDSGDLIFQADISPLFQQDKDQFRAVCEELNVPIHHVFMDRGDFPPEVCRRMLDFLYDKPVINCGFMLGPVSKFVSFWRSFEQLVIDYRRYCTDQLVVNYVLYREGFRALHSRYNFVLVSMLSPFVIRRGVFYDAAGAVIPVVHNAGIKQFTRKIANFGYGPAYNRRRWLAPLMTRCLIRAGNGWKCLAYLKCRREDLNLHPLNGD